MYIFQVHQLQLYLKGRACVCDGIKSLTLPFILCSPCPRCVVNNGHYPYVRKSVLQCLVPPLASFQPAQHVVGVNVSHDEHGGSTFSLQTLIQQLMCGHEHRNGYGGLSADRVWVCEWMYVWFIWMCQCCVRMFVNICEYVCMNMIYAHAKQKRRTDEKESLYTVGHVNSRDTYFRRQ